MYVYSQNRTQPISGSNDAKPLNYFKKNQGGLCMYILRIELNL